MDVKAMVLGIIEDGNIEISNARLPYTYHHDYLRVNCKNMADFSRGDVARARANASDDELYSLALMQILNEMSPIETLSIGGHARERCLDVIGIGKKIMADICQSVDSKGE